MFGKLKMLLYLATKLKDMKSKEEIKKEIKRLEELKLKNNDISSIMRIDSRICMLYWVLND